jgi:hypothetical protein
MLEAFFSEKRMNILRNLTLKISAFVLLGACATTVIGDIDFGGNDSEYANDGECDDPRFVGGGMASSLNNIHIGRDAADCASLFQANRIRPQRTQAESSPAQCREIAFGNNSSRYSNDGECDDPRFTGPGIDNIMLLDDTKADANDCRALCASGDVWLR